MYTPKERQALEEALENLKKCGGDCSHCAKCHIYTASDCNGIYMATGCDLHREAVETVIFELA